MRAIEPQELRATVGAPTVIGDGEDLRVVRIPYPAAPDSRDMDSVCVIYRNVKIGTAQFVCPLDNPFQDYSVAGAESER